MGAPILPGFDKSRREGVRRRRDHDRMGWMRNTPVVRAADAVIMISGGISTLNELTVAHEDIEEANVSELRCAKTPAEAVELALSLAPGAKTGKTVEREFKA